MKLNVDGSYFDHLKLSRCGGVLRYENGFWHLDFSMNVQYTDITLVELWAMRRGLELV